MVDIPMSNAADYFKALQEAQVKDLAGDTYNGLILGESGVGKSHLLTTARKPVLIHSFDPGERKLRAFWPHLQDGSIMIDDRFEKENAAKPTAFNDWEREFEKLQKMKAFDNIGTYCVDSFTTFISAAKNEIAKRRGRAEQILQIQDWQVIGNIVINMVKVCTALPCDFILTGHLSLTKEEVSGKIVARFKSIPSLQVDIPLLFDEIYMMKAEEKRDGVERSIMTQPTGKYLSRTRIGSGVFDLYEKPDITYLLKKSGLMEDK